MDHLQTLDDFEAAAASVLSPTARDYFSSGADGERTLRRNREAFQHHEIWYRVLRDVAVRDLHTTVLGTEVAFPVLVAPTAYQRLAHPEGERATARGTAEAGTILVLSTLSTISMEEVAAATSGPLWFQLYVHRDRGVTRALVERAQAAGYRALVLTVDTPLLGRRLRDERNRFCLPPDLHMANLLPYAMPEPHGGKGAGDGSALAHYFAGRHDASLTFADIDWLRSITSLPIVLKGIVRPDDAVRAVGCGVAGILVSNHGGRQLDGAPATLDALPLVVAAVADRCEVLMDGGIRWGTDVLKALALGARAVLIGRPVLWGLAVYGQRGVLRVLQILREELDRAMALSGCASVPEIDRDLLREARYPTSGSHATDAHACSR